MTCDTVIPPLVRHVHGCLAAMPTATQYWVAVSGGADSTALLHLAAQACELARRGELPALAGGLQAVHIHHGLHPAADTWMHHVAALCKRLHIPLVWEKVRIHAAGEGLEAAARAARYQAFGRLLPAGAVLLTAHHQDDQAETVLLRLMRGSGLRGLAGIPLRRSLGRGLLVRPLLAWPRAALVDYCREQGLAYVADPANRDERHRRSIIRHQVLPLLRRHWPDAAAQMAHSAAYLREQEDWLETTEAQWLDQHSRQRQGVVIGALLAQPAARQLRLIQQWLREWQAPAAPARRVQEFLLQLQHAAAGRRPVLQWAQWRLQAYRQALYLAAPAFTARRPPTAPVLWHTREHWHHPWFGGLSLAPPAVERAPLLLHVAKRCGGERLLMSNGCHQTVKSILQDEQIPPWWRECVPLLYQGDELWAVGDLRLHPHLRAYLQACGGRLHWQPPALIAPRCDDGLKTDD